MLGVAFVEPLVRDVDFFGDEDLAERGYDRRPEDGHRGAHDSKVDFETGEDEHFGIPPGEVHATVIGAVFENAPKAEHSHEDDAVVVVS